ncbi:MAG: DUF2752 domain-containing protein [Clostridia bacterium]|nr:DUF2752 domain-containing protein [Clostridia bacterium]
MKRRLSGDQKKYLALNLALLALVLLFPLYYHWVFENDTPFSHCFLKEWFGVYCPLCGGTRCVWELLHFRFLQAISYNAFVVLFAALFLIWDLVTLIRFLHGKKEFPAIPQSVYIGLSALFVLFFIIRTILFLIWRIDPIGDLTK